MPNHSDTFDPRATITRAIVDNTKKHAMEMMKTIVFIDDSRFNAAVEHLGRLIDPQDPLRGSELAADTLIATAGVWPRSYDQIIPVEQRAKALMNMRRQT